jgi:hypothetical protein
MWKKGGLREAINALAVPTQANTVDRSLEYICFPSLYYQRLHAKKLESSGKMLRQTEATNLNCLQI